MDTSPIQRAVKAADLPLDRLVANTRIPKAEKLDAACRAFEAVLLRQILGDATKPVLASSATAESSVGAIYRDIITDQMSNSIARTGQLGLARSFLSQLDRRGSESKSPARPAGSAEDPGHRNPLLDVVPDLHHRPSVDPAPRHE